MIDTANQKKLLEFMKRRHPGYEDGVCEWHFMEETYEGGREWFKTNVFRYHKEGDGEFKDRIERAYRFNHTREVVDLIGKYIFKSLIARKDDAPDWVKNFWKAVTLRGLDINQFAQLLCKQSSIKGRIWVFVDSTKTSETTSQADDAESEDRVYAYIVKPENVLDYAFKKDGSLRWIKVRECYRNDEDPIEDDGAIEERFRLWTETDWFLFRIDMVRGKEKVVLIDQGPVSIGRVPAFYHDHTIGDELYEAPGLVNDIAYLDRAVGNYLSNLDAIIQDQTFSQLAIPAQNLLAEDDAETKVLEMGTKRIFTYDGEGGAKPEYLSPDPKQAQLILAVIEKIINEIYHTIGAAGERTKQDNATGIDNSSGVAKAYDFTRLNSLLVMKAQSLEIAEKNLLELVAAYNSETNDEENLVIYPSTFDVVSLADEFSIATSLSTISAPPEVRRQQMSSLVDKMFPQLAAPLKAQISAGIRKWLDPEEMAKNAALASPPTNSPSDAAGKKAPDKSGLPSRQGQVTKDTKQ